MYSKAQRVVIEARNLRGRMFNDYENLQLLAVALNGPLQSGP
jgi:hypothetical protein